MRRRRPRWPQVKTLEQGQSVVMHESAVVGEIADENPLEREWREALATVAVAIGQLTKAHQNLMHSRDFNDPIVDMLRSRIEEQKKEIIELRADIVKAKNSLVVFGGHVEKLKKAIHDSTI